MNQIEDYQSRMAGCLKQKKFYDWVTMSLYVTAFVASAAAAIAAAAGGGPKELVAAIAAVPSISALALTTFRPEARAQWWWAKYSKLDDLVSDMQYQKKKEADAAEEFKKFLKSHQSKYPGFGSAPAA